MPRSVDRLDLLEVFAAVAEHGSLSAAGRTLGRPQPTVSRQLRALEELVGAELVRRSTHALDLTQTGHALLVEARDLLERWARIQDRLQMSSAVLAGEIRVLASAGLGQTLVPDVLGEFMSSHPMVSVELELDEGAPTLGGRPVDVWLTVRPIGDESLIAREVFSIERVVVARDDFPSAARHPGELAGQRAIALRGYSEGALTLLHAGGDQASVRPRVVAMSSNLFVVERLVQSGGGFAVLPLWLVEKGLREGTLRRLCPDWKAPPLPVSLAYATDRFRPARVEALLEFLRTRLPEIGAGIVCEPTTSDGAPKVAHYTPG